MTESDISRAIQIAATKEGWRLFRQNTALAWVGEPRGRTATSITLLNPRPLRAGLTRGSADLIGWVPVPRRNGAVAVFLSVEVKTARGRMSGEQVKWRDNVNAAGGIAITATSAEDAVRKIRDAIAALTA